MSNDHVAAPFGAILAAFTDSHRCAECGRLDHRTSRCPYREQEPGFETVICEDCGVEIAGDLRKCNHCFAISEGIVL